MAEPFVSKFTMDDARKAGLSDKITWKQYPANMLRWRAVGNALHIVCPDVVVGLYTPEELGANVNAECEIIDVTPAYGEISDDPGGSIPAAMTTPAEVIAETGEVVQGPITEAQESELKALAMAHWTGEDNQFKSKEWNEFTAGLVGVRPDHKPYLFKQLNTLQAQALMDRINDMFPAEVESEEESPFGKDTTH
jgi:hypothetical protein